MILQRHLAGYSSWGHKESDMTELVKRTHTHPSYCLLVASPLSLDVGYLFYFYVFSDVFQHPPVDICSAARCDFGVLAGEDEHTSFYSTILISSITVPFSIWTPWNLTQLLLKHCQNLFIVFNFSLTLF